MTEDEREELVYRLLEEFTESIGGSISDESKYAFISGARSALFTMHKGKTMTGGEKILWLINYWKVAAKRSQSLALTVSGESEAAEIYHDTENALRELYATHPRS